jgi:hypothetical protein
MSEKGYLVLMAIGYPSAPVKIDQELNAVASPVEQQKFDWLTGSWLQARIPSMKMAGESLTVPESQ